MTNSTGRRVGPVRGLTTKIRMDSQFIAIAGIVVAICLGVPSTWLALRELYYLPRTAEQHVLDRLRDRTPTGLTWQGTEQSFQQRVDQVVRDGMDVSELRSTTSVPDRHLWKAVKRLYRDNRIEVFLLKGITSDPVPTGQDGDSPAPAARGRGST